MENCSSRYVFPLTRSGWSTDTLAKGLQVVLSMLIGPAAARPGGDSTGVGGHADVWNMQTMTIPPLAFAATVVGHLGAWIFCRYNLTHLLQASYALSGESTCRWMLKCNQRGFNNLAFYNCIIKTVKSWGAEERRSLLLWWNRYETLLFLSKSSFPASF